jgi:hypothetical protein
MKILLLMLLFLTYVAGSYADEKYEKAVTKNLEKMDECKTATDYINIANSFERIALAENNKWLPFYYASLNYVLASYIDSSNTQKEMYLDKAVKFISIADSLESNNSEIYTIKGMISQSRMQVDPMNRLQKSGDYANMNFEKAVELDTLNPRPEYMIGVGVFYTPKQFGGGPEKAKPILENSWRKYEQFVPANNLMPIWGKQMVEELLKRINEVK